MQEKWGLAGQGTAGQRQRQQRCAGRGGGCQPGSGLLACCAAAHFMHQTWENLAADLRAACTKRATCKTLPSAQGVLQKALNEEVVMIGC